MAAGDSGFDAFLIFGAGSAGTGDAPEVKGESIDKATHKHAMGEGGSHPMQITSYKLGFELETEGTEETKDKGGEASAHEPNLGAVTIVKSLDAASPHLLAALCVSARYDDVWIWQRKAGSLKGQAGDYFIKIRLGKVHISNIDWDAQDGPPTETLTLKYEQIKIEYYPQKATGELEKAQHYSWPDKDHRHSRKRDGKLNGSRNGELSQSQMQDVVNQVVTKISRLNPNLHIRTS